MRNPEDTKYVWDEKNFNIIQKNIMKKETTDWKKELQEFSDINSCIKESEVLYRMPTEEHTNWDNFMRGKTCPILDNGDHGVYSWDLKQFLSKLK